MELEVTFGTFGFEESHDISMTPKRGTIQWGLALVISSFN